MYKLIENGVIRLTDGATIPNCSNNRDWNKYQMWLSEGNVPQELDVVDTTTDNIEFQIKALDIKRIRAIAEPSIKDEATGLTWLDYYNQQITDLRTQLTGI